MHLNRKKISNNKNKYGSKTQINIINEVDKNLNNLINICKPKPIFSFIGPAIRSRLYKRFYNSLSRENDIPFEIIFVGYSLPEEEMPSNFQYIFSKVKPSQCIEIALRKAVGDFVVFAVDDEMFSDDYLNILESHVSKYKNDSIFFGSRYKYGGRIIDRILKFDLSDKTSPKLGLAACVKRNLLIDSGGIDKRFISGACDMDVQMRMYEMGNELMIIPELFIDEDIVGSDGYPFRRSFSLSGKYDLPLVYSLWKINGQMSNKRLSPVQSFSDKDILTISQGRNCYSADRWV